MHGLMIASPGSSAATAAVLRSSFPAPIPALIHFCSTGLTSNLVSNGSSLLSLIRAETCSTLLGYIVVPPGFVAASYQVHAPPSSQDKASSAAGSAAGSVGSTIAAGTRAWA